ncbi:hypothetical protein [Sideroxydans lithotrophicus]|uniref:Uncharacterized protein n=1 Tax=Sideroxydans lithotrophicus (strain ES-1) TaxID=580332 RepID=D5CUF3_SIDLE|nr:hypothetical protein [Sideroxydans lithotrophicus]ADE10488.1 hypothetical protein Slit_0246 [Sideroxydans lithotrophicus ES-1]
MQRISTLTKVLNLFGIGKHGFQNGDMATSTPPTDFNADWCNHVQEEIANVIEGAGMALDAGSYAQMREAIKRMIDIQAGNYALDTGVANAYVIALDPPISAYVDGMTVRFRIVNSVTGASTLDAGAGAVGLVNDVGGALANGDGPAETIIAATYVQALNKFMINELVTSQALSQAAADSLYYPRAMADSIFSPPVRQTVLSGNVDTSGYSSFGGATGGTTVTAASTLKATAAFAAANRTGSIVNPQWTGLSTNGTMYLGLTINADGTCTPFATALAPVYQWGGAYSTTNGQRTFNVQEMTMKVGNGATAAQAYDVFVGEVTVAGGVVTALVWYALMGRYDSGWFAIATTTTYSKAANLGVVANAVDGFVSKNANGLPAFKAAWNPDGDGARGHGCLIEQTDRNTVKMKTEYTSVTVNANTNYAADLPTASGYGRLVASRGW